MAKTLTIVGLGGSLANVSTSRAALQLALEGAATAGAETQLLDIRQLNLPMYNPDDDEPTETAARLIEACYAADGMLWSSPMYPINTMEFATRALRAWAVPYVVPVAAAARVFDRMGQIQDQAVELQLKTLGGEVVRVAERFVTHESPDHETECARAAERVATAA